jgi:hypothetical protein
VSVKAAELGHEANERHESIALREDGHVNELARTLFAILTDKVAQAPWKTKKIMKISRGVVIVELADKGGEAVTIEAGFGEIGLRSGKTSVPDIYIKVPSEKLGLLANVPLGPAHFPALWKGDGKKLLGGILSRKIRCKGMLTRPRLLVRMLSVLGTP